MITEGASNGISLLDLPQDIRYRIYYFVGLYRTCPIILAGRPASQKCHRGLPWTKCCSYQNEFRESWLLCNWDCFCLLFPTSILMVCQSLHAESLTYFYGSNKFKLYGDRPSDLDILYTLSPLALSSITSLLVQLNYWPWSPKHDGSFHLDERYSVATGASDECLNMVQAWERLCKYLSKRIQPNQLRLTFICDTARLPYAEQLCQSMTYLPCLQNCNIRLGPFPNRELSSLARITAEKQMRMPQPRGQSFQFFHLPKEIRLQILQYTHLDPAAGTFPPYVDHLSIVNGQIRSLIYTDSKHSQCCRVCTETKDCCCCSWLRAAFSPTCACRFIPSSLFLVSKQMKQEAEYVLFRSNRLDFHGDVSKAVVYLDCLGKQNLWSIRHIRFVFSRQQLETWGKKTRSEWGFVVNYIKNNLNIKNLCLVVDAQENYVHQWGRYLWVENKNESELILTYRMFCEIALELKVLRGLQDLHLKLPRYKSLEKLLEQEVIGNGYDSYHGIRRSKEREPNMKPRYSRLPLWHIPAWKAVTSEYAH